MLKDRQAFVYLHDQGLLVGSYSGPGACVQEDWAQRTVWLKSLDAVSERELGAAIRAAWAQCREAPLVPYKEVLAKHSEATGATNLKKLFAGVRLVSPFLKDGTISIGATKQTGVGEFEPLPITEVKLTERASDEELGAAVIEALRASD
jgi:hypothetical protein